MLALWGTKSLLQLQQRQRRSRAACCGPEPLFPALLQHQMLFRPTCVPLSPASSFLCLAAQRRARALGAVPWPLLLCRCSGRCSSAMPRGLQQRQQPQPEPQAAAAAPLLPQRRARGRLGRRKQPQATQLQPVLQQQRCVLSFPVLGPRCSRCSVPHAVTPRCCHLTRLRAQLRCCAPRSRPGYRAIASRCCARRRFLELSHLLLGAQQGKQPPPRVRSAFRF